MNPIKERDKSYKRKSYLNRSRPVEVVSINHSSDGKKFINPLFSNSRFFFIDIFLKYEDGVFLHNSIEKKVIVKV